MTLTYDDIQRQESSWKATIPTVVKQWRRIEHELPLRSDTQFLFIGSGSSLYLAQSAAQIFREVTRYNSYAIPSSEIFLSDVSTVPAGTPVVAFVISRSGVTSEALRAAGHLRAHWANVTVIGLTCNEASDLRQSAHHLLTLPHVAERAIVMTNSFTSMLLALQLAAALIAKDDRLRAELDRLPERLGQLMPRFEQYARALGDDLSAEQFIFLGLGPNYGLAEEGALKLKEMTQTPCDAYNPLEFRHGPISTVRPGTAVLVLEGLREKAYARDLESDLRQHGASVHVVGPYPSPAGDWILQLPTDLTDVGRCLLYVPPLQLLAFWRSRARGLDPDRPRNLNQVVTLD